MTAPIDANDIAITRLYDAPVSLVWEVFTDPKHAPHWWGPRGFSLTTHSKDLRAGGSWHYTMHGPDGKDWPNYTRYHDVEFQRRLVYDHGASSADAAPMFRVTADFRDLGGKTELDMRMSFPSVEAAQQARVFIKAAGGNGTWDRLAEYLEKTTTSQEIFVVNRSFDAPIETVFDMWTTPAHLATWLPPAGFAMAFNHADIRTGGDAAFSMSNGEFTMYASHAYVQVRRPDLLQYTQVFTDADWKVSRQPGSPTWPEATLTTVVFVAEGPSSTRVTVRFDVAGAPTADDVATFVAERGGMTQGWSGSFDALDAVLEAVKQGPAVPTY